MSEETNTVRCARVDFEDYFQVKTEPNSLGAFLVAEDGETILRAYSFMSEAAEVKFLEELFQME